MNTLQNLRAEG